ncbi:AraC family transcriptional regulator [Chitinophaga flava]|uniref:AraC family transcriptional regulator n=1 Tax=Chitinophaga flava TaxID=2259036 RepID=A0A365XW70_9BACT|nr:helix-turn-helix domain-containing protein [Chitinophaga flava]RBL90241.1 AraC family transcriptional regulator [Chitinophaga flava]
MDAKIILPISSLRKYIRFFWVLENDSTDLIEKFKIIPEGVPGFVFQENPTAIYNKDNQVLPQSFLFGQATQYAELSARGCFRNIGVSFQPTALKSVFGIEAIELTQQHIDINDLVKTTINNQLLNSSSLAQQIAALEQFFLQQTAGCKEEGDKITVAILQIQKGRELKQVQADLKISERSLERLFKKYVGISPKLYSRICRFQASLKMLRKASVASLTEIAYRENYFDQSHFIREFKFFAGTTPTSFLLDANERFPDFPEWR